ncbi:MAG: selenide, water dikinase SelD [Candidatus Hydrogenedentales bacterium]
MRNQPIDYTHIVLLGGGHSHVEVLRRFGMRPAANVRLSLIAKELHAPYSGMLPGLVAGRYGYYESHIDLRPLCHFANCKLIHAEVVGVDVGKRQVLCSDRPAVPFDLLSINVGSAPSLKAADHAEKYAIPVKPVERFLDGWVDIVARVNNRPNDFRIVTVGAGGGGVELTLNMQDFLYNFLDKKGARREGLQFTLVSDTGEVLPQHNAGVRRRLTRILQERNVLLERSARVVEVNSDSIRCDSGAVIPYDALVWVTGAAPLIWIGNTELDKDDAGFIATDEYLRSTSHDFVFAVGDTATIVTSPRPKSGVFAVRQGPVLAENLRRMADGMPLKKFTPQKDFLSLIGTGDDYAVGSRGRWSFEGRWAWKLKERIDRRWMQKYNDLPEMAAPVNVSAMADMRCAGCGSKVASEALSRALDRLLVSRAGDGGLGLHERDDAATFTPPPGKTLVQSVDFFPPLIDDAYTAGRIAALHCLNDLYAMNATPAVALAIATLPPDKPDMLEQTLYELLAGAQRTVQEDGATLAGGHTTEGHELVFGLSVTGYADEQTLWRKSGLRAGDHFILTKPLGTGLIFAADMRRKARGDWIADAVEQMLTSNRAAAEVFRRHGVVSCTDVSGFGLAVHLREMLDASGVGAQVDLSQLRHIDGAFECIKAGYRSSLHAANEAAATRALRAPADVQKQPHYPLLFDPQTAGGLLAGVPAERAEACVTALRRAGYLFVSEIGVVQDGTDAGAACGIINLS